MARCRRLFDLPGSVESYSQMESFDMSQQGAAHRERFLAEIDRRNRRWFEQKTESVEAWASERDPGRGTIVGEHELNNQRGEVIMRMRARGFIARRPA